MKKIIIGLLSVVLAIFLLILIYRFLMAVADHVDFPRSEMTAIYCLLLLPVLSRILKGGY